MWLPMPALRCQRGIERSWTADSRPDRARGVFRRRPEVTPPKARAVTTRRAAFTARAIADVDGASSVVTSA